MAASYGSTTNVIQKIGYGKASAPRVWGFKAIVGIHGSGPKLAVRLVSREQCRYFLRWKVSSLGQDGSVSASAREEKYASESNQVTDTGFRSQDGEQITPLQFAADVSRSTADALRVDRVAKRKSERQTYLVAAIASSIGITSLAIGAVVYRFVSQMQTGGEVPYLEIFGTLALAVGAAVGMEFWARWAHRALWHDSLWNMHESHHKPREGPFELNDVFAIINAGPAILLLAYGFFNPGLVPGLCFGAGLGITLFGMAYMFVHDGLVHRRFHVGPIADVPYLQKVAAAHQLHHADKYKGVPYGLFLGPQELADVGGLQDLYDLLEARKKPANKGSGS